MKKTYYMPLLIGVIGALLLIVFGTIRQETILFAFAMAILSVGFGIGGLMLAMETDRRMSVIDEAIKHIESMQKEIREEQKEQSEQRSSSPQIIPTLQAISQYYTDFIHKQKEEDKK